MVIVRTAVRNLISARKQQQHGLCVNSEQMCPFPSRTSQKLKEKEVGAHQAGRSRKACYTQAEIFVCSKCSVIQEIIPTVSHKTEKNDRKFLKWFVNNHMKWNSKEEIICSAVFSCSFYESELLQGGKDQLPFLHICHWWCLVLLACQHYNTWQSLTTGLWQILTEQAPSAHQNITPPSPQEKKKQGTTYWYFWTEDRLPIPYYFNSVFFWRNMGNGKYYTEGYAKHS